MILWAALLLSLAAIAFSAVKRVPVGQVYSLHRHGKPLRLLQPGTHVVLPWLDRVAHRIDLGGRVLRFEQPLADARDVRGTVYWQVLEPERADAMIDQADQLIRHGALEALQGETQAHPDGQALGTALKQSLNGLLRERGVMVTRVELELA
ncbi:SPFH domain-containing protein [Dyella sp. A6]|uniref:SPFH domain-containing protein n=1 Tax=Dyella aluminiiresistens TaxID=3069105 RepID=UPI002E7A1C72|nr:SPFH domain-containing protein [Dyella sp. A6]